MEVQSGSQDDFWEEVTDQLCAIIAEELIVYDPDCLSRKLAEAERDGPPLSREPSFGQAAEEVEFAKPINLTLTRNRHANVIDVGKGSGEGMTIDPRAEADLSPLKLTSSSNQVSDIQHNASDSEPPHNTPTRIPALIYSSSRTMTPSKSLDPPKSMAREDLNGSPTPAAATIIEDHDMLSSPTLPSADTVAKSPKRRLTFGMPVFESEDEVRMPPPKLRKASPTVEDQTFWAFVNADAVANTSVEIKFRDIRQTSTASSPIENEVPKTPMLVEFGLPASPVINITGLEESYPACVDGEFADVPVHHLKSLRKTVDPTFRDDRYWADSLYFCEEPRLSIFCGTEESKVHSSDWRIIFHALDNNADRRIPLPDTTTARRIGDEQANEILSRFRGDEEEKGVVQARMLREWTKTQMAEAGLQWTQERYACRPDPPEFTTRSSQDVCTDTEFRLFCSSAQFVEGRPGVMPKGLALRQTFGVLKYARLPNNRLRPQFGGLQRQPTELAPQQAVFAYPTPLINDGIMLGGNQAAQPLKSAPRSYQPVLSIPAQTRQILQTIDPFLIMQAAQALPPIHMMNPAQAAQPDHITHPTQTQNPLPPPPQNNTAPLIARAFQDVRIFVSLPRNYLLHIHEQFLQARASQCIQQSRPIPRDLPTANQLWLFFRQCCQMNAARQMQARAGAEAQESMLRNSFVGTPAGQLQAHMPVPRTPGRGNVGVTSLGSPFRTPARGGREGIDPRLLHS